MDWIRYLSGATATVCRDHPHCLVHHYCSPIQYQSYPLNVGRARWASRRRGADLES